MGYALNNLEKQKEYTSVLGSAEVELTVFEAVARDIAGVVSDLNEINAILYQFNGRAFGNTLEETMDKVLPASVTSAPIPVSAHTIDYLIKELRKEVGKVFDALRTVRKIV